MNKSTKLNVVYKMCEYSNDSGQKILDIIRNYKEKLNFRNLVQFMFSEFDSAYHKPCHS